MKIKAFAALVKQTKILKIYNVLDAEGVITQWASNGIAFYPMAGLPLVDTLQLLRMLDIPEKDNKGYAQEIYDCNDIPEEIKPKFAEFWESEGEGTDLGCNDSLVIDWLGDTMVMLYEHNTGAVYPMMIKYLKPLSKADDRPMFFYRSGMIAIKSGLLLQGLVYAGSLAHQSAMTDCLIQLGSTIRRSQLIQMGNAIEQSLEANG